MGRKRGGREGAGKDIGVAWEEESQRTDQRNPQDNIRRKYRRRDRDPPQALVQLERQQQDVHPRDLADGDAVRQGQRGVEDALRAREHVVHRLHRVERVRLVDAHLERVVVVHGLQVRGEVAQDLEGEVAEGQGGLFEELARVGFEEGEAEEEAEGFE